MRFPVFFVTFLRLRKTFAVHPSEGLLSDRVESTALPDRNDNKGYECGNVFFTYSETRQALQLYHQYLNRNPAFVIQENTSPQVTPQKFQALDNYVPQQNVDFPGNSFPQESDVSLNFDIDKEIDNLKEFNDQNYYNIFDDFNVQEYDNAQYNYGLKKRNDFGKGCVPREYHGRLYGDADTSKYILWPIVRENLTPFPSPINPFYIVIDRNGDNIIDVIASMANGDYIKCIRRDSSLTNFSTPGPETTNGYVCTHEFLSDGLITNSLMLAKKNGVKNSYYPKPYFGNLYPRGKSYKLWPIFARRKLYRGGSSPVEPFFLIINKKYELVDVVAKGVESNFIRCSRSYKIVTISIPDTPNVAKRSGFQCGKLFFDIEDIKRVGSEAKGSNFLRKSKKLPQEYDGPPFNEPVLLWPILSTKRGYKKGSLGPYRVVLTPDHKIKGAAYYLNKKIRKCEPRKITGQINHDPNDYYCLDFILRNQHLIRSTKIGCSKMTGKTDTHFPALYEGPKFEKVGPYFTYPVYEINDFKTNAGLHRVVFNADCEVVGALTTMLVNVNTKADRQLVKCIKLKDSETSFSSFDPENPISEHRFRN
ncbi:putative secreted effector protein [Erysiphe necator]|uniref:Putative secreted effector protein n=1 Tax=Uncinula necator TaxID=52586 RepID=A0A0B1P371_UNCNE|nr:putative secreted effector protein [Erysiphe necator]